MPGRMKPENAGASAEPAAAEPASAEPATGGPSLICVKVSGKLNG